MQDITFHGFEWGFMGDRLVCETSLKQDYISATYYINQRIENPFMLPLVMATLGNIKIKYSVRRTDTHLYAVISKRLHSHKSHNDLLQQLLDLYCAGKSAELLVLRNQVKMLFGFLRLPANMITWKIYHLCKYLRVAVRLYAEIDELPTDNRPTIDDMLKLPYMQMVVDELLRLYPTALSLSRLCTTADRICGYWLPAGAKIFVLPYAIYRDDRFSTFKIATIPRHAYIPWNLCSWTCVARQISMLQIKIVWAAIIQQYTFICLQVCTVVPEADFSLGSACPVQTTLIRR
jgi:cytochrome P450